MTDSTRNPSSQEAARARAAEALRYKGPTPAAASADWRPIKLSAEDRKHADKRGDALLAEARARFK